MASHFNCTDFHPLELLPGKKGSYWTNLSQIDKSFFFDTWAWENSFFVCFRFKGCRFSQFPDTQDSTEISVCIFLYLMKIFLPI